MALQKHGSFACWKREAPETRARIARRVLGHLRFGMPLANAIGAIIVYLYFAWAFPPEYRSDAFGTYGVNAIVGVIYFGLAATYATWRGERANEVLKRWRQSDAPSTDRDRRQIMRIPSLMVELSAINWGCAIPIFFLINLDYSADLAWDV